MFDKYRIVFIFTLIVNGVFLILSFFNKYPWVPFGRHCLSMSLFTIICYLFIFGEIYYLMKTIWKNSSRIVLSIILIVTVILRFNVLKLKHLPNTYTNFINVDISEFKQIYVDRWESPCIRYLFEYGSLKNNSQKYGYPEKLTFAKYDRHGWYDEKIILTDYYKFGEKMNDLLEYDLLIVPELVGYGSNDKWVLIDGTSNFYVKKGALKGNENYIGYWWFWFYWF